MLFNYSTVSPCTDSREEPDFFQSSMEDIELGELENVFVPANKAGKVAVRVVFKPNPQGQNRKKAYAWNKDNNDTQAASDTSIRDGNKLKSFLTYKHLLAIHHLKKDERINLFDLLVKGVLKQVPLANRCKEKGLYS